MRVGFSLVELSIVLVILGLLTGGILAGQSLIRASELRAVSTEYSRYVSAIYSFRGKYFVPPGDFSGATKFWLRQNAGAWCVTNSSAAVGSPGTCDGNAGGTISSAAAASQSGEEYQVWRQLALAGLIEGDYTGTAGTGALDDLVRGSNVPASRLGNSIWRLLYYGAPAANMFNVAYDNSLIFGFQDSGTAIMKVEEAWNIDTKLDDGRPAYGRLITRPYTCSTAAGQSDLAVEYDLDSAALCLLMSPKIF